MWLDRTLAVIELSLSSGTAPISAPVLATWLSEQQVSAEVHPLCASIPHPPAATGASSHRLESGAKVVLFECTPRYVKDKLWPHLVKTYNIQCAYVNAGHLYCGCVLNWPGVFCPTRCPGQTPATPPARA